MDLERGISKGEQNYETDESMWPVSEPIEKLEAKWQCSGEIQYVGDIPMGQGELHGAFVMANQANCDIASIDTTKALVRVSIILKP